METKKIGMWGGGFIGSFLVLLVAAYFLFPYLNSDKAEKVQAENEPVQKASFNPSNYSLQTVDSLQNKIVKLQEVIDSLRAKENLNQQLVDSLNQRLAAALETKPEETTPVSASLYNAPVGQTSKSLLSLDEDVLAPIVDLLEENQLISLYIEGSNRQRKKLLKTLKPEKAAKILKKVM